VGFGIAIADPLSPVVPLYLLLLLFGIDDVDVVLLQHLENEDASSFI